MANEPRVPRLLFIDNLRIALMVLVIAYHVGLAYGPGDWWYFQNPDRSPMLRPFFTVNRAFFMSLFFMISGYFLPASYDRRGAGDFLKDRLLRMGIPLVVFLLVVIPVIMYAYCLNFRNYDRLPFLVYYWKLYFGWGGRPPGWSGPSWPDMQLGHLWFVQHLLIFALCYSVWRLIRGPLPGVDREAERLPENLKIIVFILALTAVTFVVRIWYPIYKWTAFLGFIQVSFADVPRDLSFFIIGVIARYRNWFINMPKSTGIAWLAIGVASAALCFGLEITGAGCFSAGGANGLSLAHCLWESLLCTGLCIGLPVLFRENFNSQGTLTRELAGSTYAVYLFHVPVVVSLQYAMTTTEVPAIGKFAIVTLVAVPLAFLIGGYLRRLPFARRVL